MRAGEREGERRGDTRREGGNGESGRERGREREKEVTFVQCYVKDTDSLDHGILMSHSEIYLKLPTFKLPSNPFRRTGIY